MYKHISSGVFKAEIDLENDRYCLGQVDYTQRAC